MLLRSIFGRPRFLVGRLGVEDSDAEAAEAAELGDSRLSMCGLSEGDAACWGPSPQCEEVRDVVVAGETHSASPACGGVEFIELSYGYWPNGCPNCAGLKICGNGCGMLVDVEFSISWDFDEMPDVVSTDVTGWSKKESESKNVFSV